MRIKPWLLVQWYFVFVNETRSGSVYLNNGNGIQTSTTAAYSQNSREARPFAALSAAVTMV